MVAFAPQENRRLTPKGQSARERILDVVADLIAVAAFRGSTW